MIGRRTAVVGVIVVLAVVGAVGFAFAYPFERTDRTVPFDGLAESDGNESAEVTATLIVDGRQFVAYDGVLSEDGSGFLEIELDDSSYRAERYSTADETVYSRIRVTNESQADGIGDEEEYDVLERAASDGLHTVHTKRTEPASLVDEYVSPRNGFVVSAAIRPDYDRVDTETSDGEVIYVYEPRESWNIDDYGNGVRITNADGEARVDADTGELHAIDVSYDVTEASSYGEYYLERGETGTISVTYEYEAGEVDVDRPEWLDE